MKHLTHLSFICTVLFLVSCNSEPKELTEQEQRIYDSVSKAEQKRVSDSLKRGNPLLILPPDSEYTGTYIDKYPSGIVKFKGFYRFGERHGQWFSFYPNGLMWSEMHYDKGLRHGVNNTFYLNGKPRYTGFYKNDKRDSIWTFYDTLGNLAEKVLMKNDREVKRLP
ncbi:MAG: hypothetical protein KF900_10835 [Bacteroidetes bacterium]|nr:hypothetical protein [Bacteroidota bacterium]